MAIATFVPTAALARVDFLPGLPLYSPLRQIRIPGPPGLSAYQVAVANGFEGSEAEWLESLQGGGGGGGSGDMLKSVYDPENTGKVLAAAEADSVPWEGVAGRPGTFPPAGHGHALTDIEGAGSMAAQDADDVAISGGAISGVLLGDVTIDRSDPEAEAPVVSAGVHRIVPISQEEYDALDPPDPATLYILPEAAIKLRLGAVAIWPGEDPGDPGEEPGEPWTPEDYEGGLGHWYDASDSATLTLSGAIVTGWADKSGNGHHLTQETEARRGTLTAETAAFNDLPTIAFPSAGGMLSASKESFHNTGWLTDSTNAGMRYGTTGARGPLGWSLPTNAILVARFPEGTLTAGNVLFRRNGATYSPNGTEGTVNSAGAGTAIMVGRVKSYGQDIAFGRILDGATGFTIGNQQPGWDRTANIDFAEIITLPGELGLEDIERFEGYLAHKWGLAGELPSAHPYRDTPPALPPE